MKSLIESLTSAVLSLSFAGCASYIPPGAKADLQAFAPPSIQEGFAAKPTAPFPAGIAAVRVQAPSYSNYHLQQNGGRHGDGRYTVILTREVEEQSQFDRVTSLPQVSGVIGLNVPLITQDGLSNVAMNDRGASSRSIQSRPMPLRCFPVNHAVCSRTARTTLLTDREFPAV